MLISNGWASCVTEASPEIRRARIARRVGSARAAKVVLSWSEVISYLTHRLNTPPQLVCQEEIASIQVRLWLSPFRGDEKSKRKRLVGSGSGKYCRRLPPIWDKVRICLTLELIPSFRLIL